MDERNVDRICSVYSFFALVLGYEIKNASSKHRSEDRKIHEVRLVSCILTEVVYKFLCNSDFAFSLSHRTLLTLVIHVIGEMTARSVRYNE
jgi:hypothetical protein